MYLKMIHFGLNTQNYTLLKINIIKKIEKYMLYSIILFYLIKTYVNLYNWK